ncbi:hypothetical protein [Dyadobacter sp. CY343]|uniref:hypothetical protein n=1 Tax=Dyadobacter sp. CY343 TaxID=2907299 RepID=UPI001F31178B|nr:hypothetical protein [Dyadobacter sp. CY343]MCE7061234.1 hypothetical protein [Dyadobacter sp. CY343]
MLFPVKLKLAHYEAEAMRQYMFRLLQLAADPRAKNEVIIIAEYFQRFDTLVRGKVFKLGKSRVGIYTIPLSVARILWFRWQQEDNGDAIQSILGKVDYELNAQNRVPIFPKTLI